MFGSHDTSDYADSAYAEFTVPNQVVSHQIDLSVYIVNTLVTLDASYVTLDLSYANPVNTDRSPY